MMQECATGIHPFNINTDQPRTKFDIMEDIMHGKPSLLQKYNGYSARFCRIIKQLMSKDPEKRL